MSPQAIRGRSGRPGRPRRPPVRTLLILLGAALAAFLLGRLALPLAVLLVLALAASLWLGPEIAYWLDDELLLHRLPGFGEDHRQLALASFAYLMVAAVLGSLSLGGLARSVGGVTVGQATPTTLSPSPEALATAPTPTARPTEPPPPTTQPPPAPTVAPPIAAPGAAQAPSAPAAAPLVEPKPAPPTRPQPIAQPVLPTPTVAVASVPPIPAAAPVVSPARQSAADRPPVATTAKPAAQPKPEATLPPLGRSSGLVAEIAGVTTVARPGGRATLQARATPGAQCEVSVRYPDGRGGPVGTQSAGDDGLCTLSWTVPSEAQSGWGTATLVVRQDSRVETRRVSFTVAQ